MKWTWNSYYWVSTILMFGSIPIAIIAGLMGTDRLLSSFAFSMMAVGCSCLYLIPAIEREKYFGIDIFGGK